MIKHRNKPGSAYKKAWMQENGQNKFRTIVSEVSSFLGNPVYLFYRIGVRIKFKLFQNSFLGFDHFFPLLPLGKLFPLNRV